MTKTRIELTDHKSKNMMFTCHINDMHAGMERLNKLLTEGWLVEKSEQVGDRYVALLKQLHRVFYVDVTDIPPDELFHYLESAKRMLTASGNDFFVPVR